MAGLNPGALVVGVGNTDRGDDAAGRAVSRWLRGKLPDGIVVLDHDGEVTALLACLETVDTAYLVDACMSGAQPGTVHRFDAAATPLPQQMFSLSSHGLGLSEAIELARALGQLPRRCVVYAIEAASFEPGAALSNAVAAAVAVAGRRVRDELSGKTLTRGGTGA